MSNSPQTVVYTAVFGDYDVVLDPSPVEDHVDYVCFTDTPEKIPDAWETRSVSLPTLSPKLKSGRVKSLPHEYFPAYDRSIWVDANITIVGQLSVLADKLLEDVNVAVPSHRHRNCIYDEAAACVEHGIADPAATEQKMNQYRNAGFPREYGLSETRVLVRQHTKAVLDTMEVWWEEYRSGPERDQLSFEYAMWKTGLAYHQLDPYISVDSSFFKYYPHKQDMVGKRLYETLLRGRWNADSVSHHLLARAFLPVYLGVMPAARAVRVLRTHGPQEVLTRFNNRYVR